MIGIYLQTLVRHFEPIINHKNSNNIIQNTNKSKNHPFSPSRAPIEHYMTCVFGQHVSLTDRRQIIKVCWGEHGHNGGFWMSEKWKLNLLGAHIGAP